MAKEEDVRAVSVTEPQPGHVARLDPVALQPEAVLADRYDIGATLGKGGTGVVMRAYDRVLREEVAIKVLRPEYAAERRWVQRLAREVKLARQIRHPNVCRVFDFEQADGHTFVVMELARRGTLRAELDRGVVKARPLRERLGDARAIVAGLAAIHEAGIIHRDVTPQNVLRMADGRLVVSDFGLAIGVGETTTSIQGGTISYMSPEVVRGARASFAADVWSLGVVVHEVVFGEKPRWRSPTSFDLLAPDVGRTLTRDERLVLEACRACTSANPGRRPRRAGEVAAQLNGRGARRWVLRSRRWLALAGLALALAGAGAAVVRAVRSRLEAPASLAANPLITPTGTPSDWTDISKVLMSIPARVRCLAVLPDGHTVRLVWGAPARAEDVDVTTGRHGPSPLVAAAYREGCPDLSPEGKLVFQGYVEDGRVFVFVSPNPDGSKAKPIVPANDPSMLSEPKWLPGGESFVFDSDPMHFAVYSLALNRMTTLPQVTLEPVVTNFRYVVGSSIYITSVKAKHPETELMELTWPALGDVRHLRVPRYPLDVISRGAGVLFFADKDEPPQSDVVALSVDRREARRVGFLPGKMIRYFSPVHGGGVFVSTASSDDIWTVQPDGTRTQITNSGNVLEAQRCASGFLISREVHNVMRIERLDRSGSHAEPLTNGPYDASPACSPDGSRWFFTRWNAGGLGLYRCEQEGCRLLVNDVARGTDVSPDGTRLAYVVSDGPGPRVRWISVDGGQPHDLGPSEAFCEPGWTSPTTLWISRRIAGRFTWVEMNADTGQPTGKTRASATGCLEGGSDPDSPVHPDVRVLRRYAAELRWLPPYKMP